MNINQDQQNLLVLGCMLSLHTMNLNMNINNITSGRQDNTRSIMGKKTATTRRRMKWTTKHHLYYFQYLEQSQDNVFLGSPASLKRPPKRRSQRVLPPVPEIAKPPLQTRDILPHPASQHEATQRQLHRQRWQRPSVAVAAERRGEAAEDGQPRGADEGPLPAPAISQGAEQQLTSHHPKQHGADHQGLRFGRNQGFTIVKLQNQHHQIDGEEIIGIRQEANATGQHSQAFQGLAIFGHQRRRLISAFLHCAMGKPRGSTPQGA